MEHAARGHRPVLVGVADEAHGGAGLRGHVEDGVEVSIGDGRRLVYEQHAAPVERRLLDTGEVPRGVGGGVRQAEV